MKIGIIVQDITKLGGVETVSIWLAQKLRSDHDVCILSLCSKDGLLFNEGKNVSIIHLNLKKDSLFSELEKFLVENPFDKLIIQLSTAFKSLCILADYKLNKILSKYSDLYVVLHESPKYFLKRYNFYLDNSLIFFMKKLYTSFYYNPQIKRYFYKSKKYVKKFITLSKGCHKELLDNFQLDSLIRYNPYQFDIQDIQIEKKENLILWAGRISPEKNLIFLLKAWNLIQVKGNWKLLIIGEGSDLERIQFYIKKNNVKNVEILQAMKHQDLIEYFKISKVYVFPSLFEGFPTVISEAMNYKNAVISTKYDGFSDELLTPETAMICDYDIEVFSNYIKKLMNDSELLRKYQFVGYEQCKKFYLEKLNNYENYFN